MIPKAMKKRKETEVLAFFLEENLLWTFLSRITLSGMLLFTGLLGPTFSLWGPPSTGKAGLKPIWQDVPTKSRWTMSSASSQFTALKNSSGFTSC